MLGSSVDSLVFETRQAVTVVPPSPQPPPSVDVREEEHEPPETLQAQDTDVGSHPGDGRQEGHLEASSDAATEPPATELPTPPAPEPTTLAATAVQDPKAAMHRDRRDGQRDALQRMDVAVVGVEVLNLEQFHR